MQENTGDRFKKCLVTAKKYNLFDIINTTIVYSKSYARLQRKPMMTPVSANETHITVRGMHVQQVSAEGREIANMNDLCSEFLETAMKLHDIAHSFSAHQGERILEDIAQCCNGTYFHHNTMGPILLIKEKFPEKVLNRVKEMYPNITDEELEKCEETIYYIFDVILSHDGESKNLITVPEHTDDIKATVRDKIRKAYGKNEYKTIATTTEGCLGKMTDVISYLKTDFLDAYRREVVDIYNSDYLIFFGQIFGDGNVDENNLDREKYNFKDMKKFEIDGLKYVQSKVDKYNEELLGDFNHELDDKTRADLKTLVSATKIPIQGKKFEALLKKYIASYKERNKDDKKLNNKIKLIKKYIKISNRRVPTEVVDNIFTEVQLKFKKAISVRHDKKGNPQIEMREKESLLYGKLRKLDYIHIVPFSRKKYQYNVLPKAVFFATEKLADSLVKSGIIKDYFENENIRKQISDPDALKYMEAGKRNTKAEEKYQNKIGLGIKKKSKLKKFLNKHVKKDLKHYKEIYEEAERTENLFSDMYMNAYHAIETRIKGKVAQIYSEDQTKKAANDKYLASKKNANLDDMKLEIIKRFGTLNITDEQKQQYIKDKVHDERKNIERIIARNLAIEYMAGTTDRSVQVFCRDLGTANWLKFFINKEYNLKQDECVADLRTGIYGSGQTKVDTAPKENKKHKEKRKEFNKRIQINAQKMKDPKNEAHVYDEYTEDNFVDFDIDKQL